jgi:hypothetical protein
MSQRTRLYPWGTIAVLLIATRTTSAQQADAKPSKIDPPAPALQQPVTHDTDGPTPAVDGGTTFPPFGVTFSADFLLLRPRERTLEYAVNGPSNPGNTGPIGSIETIEPDWSSAFRAGGGVRLPDNGWEVSAFYTYLHNARNSAVTASAGETLFATMTHPGTVSQVDTAQATNSLNYNVVDVELGRTLHPCETVAVRIFGGPRFAQIDQAVAATYDGGDANLDVVTTTLHFTGGGLSVGAEGNLDLYCGWGVFARGRFSMMLGQYRTSLVETDNAGATTITNVSENFDKVVPVLELGMGVSWQYGSLRLTAGYEMINWSNLVDVPDFVDDFNLGKLGRRVSDFSLDGLVVRAELSF